MRCAYLICDTTCMLHPHDLKWSATTLVVKEVQKTVLNAVLTFALLANSRRFNKQITHKTQHISPSYPQVVGKHHGEDTCLS
jgi:hypothetical protein